MLIFSILQVHEIGTFMSNSSVFIFLMLRALYRMICKNVKSFFGENSLNVTNVKLFSKTLFGNLGVFLMVCYFSLLEKASKSRNYSKFTKDQEVFVD